MLLQLVGRVLRIEHDGRVEEGEEDDHRGIERPCRAAGRGRVRPRSAFAQPGSVSCRGREAGDRRRQQQQRRGEDRRDDAGRVELQRQVRGVALEHAVADLALRILDQQAALGALEEDDQRDDDDGQHDDRRGSAPSTARRCGRARACRAMACGRPATMPAKMISEMPLPMPRAVICSPSHIRNIVPPTSVMTAEMRKNSPGSVTMPLPPSRPTAMP